MTELDRYLSKFPHVKVDTCFSRGSQTLAGKEGACNCANCDSYLHDVYGDDSEAPYKDEEAGHCEKCLSKYQ